MTPEPEDITISPTGPLGSRYAVGVVEGPHLGEVGEYGEAKALAYDYMNNTSFYTTLWFVDDHGGASEIPWDPDDHAEDRDFYDFE